MKMKKFSSLFLVGIMGLGALTGCSGQQAPAQEAAAPSTSESQEKQEDTVDATKEEDTPEPSEVVELPPMELENNKITFFTWHTAETMAQMPEVKLFEEFYGGEIEFVTAGHGEYYTQLATLIASGNSPDIALLRGWDWFPSLILQDQVTPIDELIDFDLPLWKGIKDINESCKWVDDKMYGLLTYDQPSTMVYYNVEMFENAGLETPGDYYERGEWTMQKLGELAEEMTIIDAEGVVKQIGVSFLGTSPGLLGVVAEPIITSENGQFVNNIKADKITGLNNWVSELAQKKAITADWSSFGRQESSMIFFHTDGPGSDFLELTERDVVDVVPYPKYDEGSDHYAISEPGGLSFVPGAKNVEGAIAFANCMRYVSTPEYQMTDEDYLAQQSEISEPVKEIRAKGLEIYEELEKLPGTYFVTAYNSDAGVTQLLDGTKTWSSVVEQISPEVDKRVAEMNDGMK